MRLVNAMTDYSFRLGELRFRTGTLIRINNLAITAQLHGKQTFLVHKDFCDLIALLKFSKTHDHQEVRHHYERLVEHIDRDTLGFFRIHGVDLKPDEVEKKPSSKKLVDIFTKRNQ